GVASEELSDQQRDFYLNVGPMYRERWVHYRPAPNTNQVMQRPPMGPRPDFGATAHESIVSERPAYWIVSIIPKIGRYIATIMPPTMTPRNRIMIGSSSASRPDTATSTSSS